MNDIREVHRLPSPAPKPQSLAFAGPLLWMGSRETKIIYSIDPIAWLVRWQIAAPGTPYGMTAVGDELRVLCSEGADDHRIIRRCLPGQGFDLNFALPCPDDSGSQLGHDGRRLHVSQWYPKKVLALASDGTVERIINVPHGICGQVFAAGFLWLVTTDAEDTNDYWLTRVDPRPATPVIEDVARIPFQARALAWDGEQFWTNHREQNEIVAFARVE
ncbi:MAG: hypothetical protein Q8N18_04740 [Opitutaceae bacterium]|nr:hypothetical protein [Opitutaceae bacterium]